MKPKLLACIIGTALFVAIAAAPVQAQLSVPLLESGFHGADWNEYFVSLDGEHGPTAYLFRCLHCGCFGGYSDVM